MKTISMNKMLGTILICMITGTIAQAQQSNNKIQQEKISYVKIEVNGLACPFCAYGLEKKLKKLEGIEDLYIELQEGSATFNIPSTKTPSEERLTKIVADAGFKARKVTFSNQPFKKKADN